MGWCLGFKSGRARALRRRSLMVTVRWKAELAGRTIGGRTWSRAAAATIKRMRLEGCSEKKIEAELRRLIEGKDDTRR